MGLADRVSAAVEKRTIGGVPWQPYVPFGSGGPVHPSRHHVGQDRALALTPVYGAVKLLADGVASLPLKIYRNVDNKTIPWTGPSLFDKPAPVGTYYDWMFQAMSSLLLHGNALGYITSRDGFQYPQQIVWLPYERCHIQDDETQDFANPVKPSYYFMGRLMDPADLLHIRAFTVAGHTAGVSPLQAFKLLIEGSHDRQAYAKTWFANGGFPPGTFKNTELEITMEQSREIRGNLAESLRLRQPLVFGRDWDYTPVSVPPEQAQFVATARLDATQVATIYQVPPDRVGGSRGDSMTYSSTEQEANDLITWSLRPWLVRFETAFFGIMPQQRFARFNADALIRADTQTRYAVHKIARDTGWMTNDEIREIEDRPPLPGGIGKETLPGDVLVAMARGMAAVPKTFDSLLITEKPPAAGAPAHVPGASVPGMPPASQPKPPPVMPPGTPPPAGEGTRDGSGYSIEDVASACFGPLGRTQAYLDHVTLIARDAGYVVISARAGSFSRAQADWMAAEALRRPRPIERFSLSGMNGHGHG